MYNSVTKLRWLSSKVVNKKKVTRALGTPPGALILYPLLETHPVLRNVPVLETCALIETPTVAERII